MIKRLLCVTIILHLFGAITLYAQKPPLEAIRPLNPFNLNNSSGFYMGNPDFFEAFDMVFVTVRTSTPVQRNGNPLNKKKFYYYAEVFQKNTLNDAPQEIQFNGLPLGTKKTVRYLNRDYWHWASVPGKLNTSEDLIYPAWDVKSSKDVPEYTSSMASVKYVFPRLYSVPEQTIPVVSVAMPESVRDQYEYMIRSESYQLKARLGETPYSKPPFVFPDGGYFGIGGYKHSGFSVAAGKNDEDKETFQAPAGSVSSILQGPVNDKEPCYIFFRSYNIYKETFLHKYGGIEKQQKWLFLCITEDVREVSLDILQR